MTLTEICKELDFINKTDQDAFINSIINFSDFIFPDPFQIMTCNVIPDTKEAWIEISKALVFCISSYYTTKENIAEYLVNRFKDIDLLNTDNNDIEERLELLKIINFLFKALNKNYTEQISGSEEEVKNDESIEFVYVIKQTNIDNLYKIGRTKNLTQRLKQHTTSNPAIEIVLSKKSQRASQEEAFIHKFFKNKKIKNEWFELDKADLEMLINIFNFNNHIARG